MRVVPRAARDAIQGVHDGMLKVRLQAPPVNNKANEALVCFLAEKLDLPRARVRLTAGAAGRTKQVFVSGLDGREIARRLGVEPVGSG
ncbi:MAG: DUF167 domain-containing protein [Verrucomicrobia bacterium]|nr:DUF167 domain-containing protein [Verrucomicrobiota bacterium]